MALRLKSLFGIDLDSVYVCSSLITKIMGVIRQGILGGFSGKVAGVVGSSWKGIAVIKALPLSVANPKTAKQIEQRTKFTNVVAFGVVILATVLKPLWDRFAQQMSGFNDFIKTNIDLFDLAVPDPVADLVISKGKMALTAMVSAQYDDTLNVINLAWVDDSGEGLKLATDLLTAVVVNATSGEIKGFATAVVRSAAASGALEMALITAADELHAYIAFKRADGTVVSNTAYRIVLSD
ncbi:hypothetical protein ES708_06300 [subsurface metagenome]